MTVVVRLVVAQFVKYWTVAVRMAWVMFAWWLPSTVESFVAVTVTVCGTFQFAGVKVSTVLLRVEPDAAVQRTTTFPFGALVSTTS